jgi:hypothetical protein
MRPLVVQSSDPRNLSIWVEALLATGGRSQAEPVITRLQRMGFRAAAFVASLQELGIDYPEDPQSDERINRIIVGSGGDRQTRQ